MSGQGGGRTSSAGLLATAQPSTSQPSLRCTWALNLTLPRCMMAATTLKILLASCWKEGSPRGVRDQLPGLRQEAPGGDAASNSELIRSRDTIGCQAGLAPRP